MLKLKALLLTQGMHGMISQVEGLSKALNLSFKHQTIRLKPFWNLIPPKFTPISENLIKDKFIFDTKVIISCGRKSVVPSIAFKKKYKEKIFTIHIQDPKVKIDNFDLIVCPDHDKIDGNGWVEYELAVGTPKLDNNDTRGMLSQVVWTKDMGKLVDLTLPDNRVVKRKFLEYVIKGSGIFTEPQGQYSVPHGLFGYTAPPNLFLGETMLQSQSDDIIDKQIKERIDLFEPDILI